MNPITTKLFAIPIAIASFIIAYSFSTPERTPTTRISVVSEQTIDPVIATEPPETSLESFNLSGVDFQQLELLIQEEQRITQQMEVDEARMLYGKCGEWHELAMAVGWPESEWPTLSYVLYRESRCNIDSWNKTDPNSGSRGLMQINGFWCRPNRYDPNGFLQSVGVLNTCEDLFNPETNLRAGLAIWTYGQNKHGCGWRGPWATACGKYTIAEVHP